MVSLTRGGTRQAYLHQLMLDNMKVRELLDVLLSPSARTPVLVIQADHGPGTTGDFRDPSDQFLGERMRILNAYYLPGNGSDLLYPSITPVNTFQLIFNYYFGQYYFLLPDRSYNNGHGTSYDYYDVTERVAFPEEPE